MLRYSVASQNPQIYQVGSERKVDVKKNTKQ